MIQYVEMNTDDAFETIEETDTNYLERRVYRLYPERRLVSRVIFFDGLTVFYGDCSQVTREPLKSEEDSIEVRFDLCGPDAAMIKNPKLPECFQLNVSRSFFMRIFPEEPMSFDMLRASLIHEQDNVFGSNSCRFIREIIECEYTSLQRRLFLGTKAMELLMLKMDDHEARQNGVAELKHGDIGKIYLVKELLLSNIGEQYTLSELAHKVGTNEYTLKKRFKEVFGTTVFGFWTEAKMEKARDLLKRSDLNIAEVAEAVGYKNPQHFSAAFKRRFGVIPSQLKKENGARSQT